MTETTAERQAPAWVPYLWKAGIPILVAVVVYFLPVPDDVEPTGMRMLGIFLGTILALILQPLPTAALALIGTAAAMLTKTETASRALAGFANTTVWLIVAAFFIAEGFLITGLGRRIALWFVTRLGRSTLGLSYGLALTDLVIAPATPSNTARCGGVVYPIVASLSHLEDSYPEPEESRKRLGAYLTLTALQVNVVTSAMFVTAMAGSPVVVELAGEMGIEISWARWALAAVVPGVVSLIAVPWVMTKIYPPTVTKTPEAPRIARDQLREAGPVSRKEWIMVGTFVLLLALWVLGDTLNIDATSAAFAGIAILLITGVLSWKNLAQNTSAWSTLIFFGVLVGMASELNELGVIDWVGDSVADAVGSMSWVAAFVVLTLVYFYSHYLFASNTAHIVAMYTIFVAAAIATGAPPLFSALVFGFISNLFGGLAHYSSGPAGVIYGSGYIKTTEFFRVAFMISVVNIVIWTSVGGAWMKLIGIW